MSNVGTSWTSRRDRDSPELFKAIKSGDEEKVRTLLADPDINVNMVYDDKTPLVVAIENSHENIVKLLLAHPKIKLNFSTTTGKYDNRTPIEVAIDSGNVEIAKLLLAHPDMDPNIIGMNERTPINNAILNGDIEIVKLFLANPKTDPNRVDERLYSPLGTAVTMRQIPIVELLLADPRVDINLQDKDEGATALMLAIRHLDDYKDNQYVSYEARTTYPKAYADIIKLLISNPNIDLEVRDKNGRTAYDLADKETKKLISDPARSIALFAHKYGFPPEVTAKIFGQVTGKEPTMEDYYDRQFEFQHKLAREAREKQKEHLRNIKKSNKGGRKTRRKPISARYSRSAKTRSSKRVQ